MWLKRYWKYFGLFVLATVLAIGITVPYLTSHYRSLLLSQLQEEIRKDLTYSSQLFQELLRSAPAGQADFNRLAREIGQNLQERVSLISADGRMLADSTREPEKLDLTDDYSHRPEIIMAREKGYGEIIRHSPFMKLTALFAAVPVYRDKTLIGFVRLARPLKAVDELVQTFRRNLILLAGLIGILAVFFGLSYSGG